MGNRQRVALFISGLFSCTVTGWCTVSYSNTNAITLGTSPADANPYPSQIVTSGLTGTLSTVSVELINWADSGANANPDNLYFLLVGPGGQTFEFLGGVGGSTPFNGVNLTASDSASAGLSTAPIISGTFKPTVYGSGCTIFPSPAPADSNCGAPDGSATFATVFDSANPNGTWSVYEFDSATGDTSSTIAGGWVLNLEGVDQTPAPEAAALFTLPAALLALLGLRRRLSPPCRGGTKLAGRKRFRLCLCSSAFCWKHFQHEMTLKAAIKSSSEARP